ncbi:hypothetical protein JCM11251_002380 [Rhodosporidiobolus azoricus]
MSLAPDSRPSVVDPSKSISTVLENDRSDEIRPGAHTAWSLAAGGWLAILSLPLLAFPRILTLVFGSHLRVAAPLGDPSSGAKAGAEVLRTLNTVEHSLAVLAGMSCLALGAILVIQTGAIPLNSSLTASRDIAISSATAPYRAPTIVVAVAFFAALTWTSYGLNMLTVSIPSGIVGSWGVWTLLFGHQGRVNQASAKASSFPFKNAPAEEMRAEKKVL